MQKNNLVHADLKATYNSASKKLAALGLVAAVGSAGLIGNHHSTLTAFAQTPEQKSAKTTRELLDLVLLESEIFEEREPQRLRNDFASKLKNVKDELAQRNAAIANEWDNLLKKPVMQAFLDPKVQVDDFHILQCKLLAFQFLSSHAEALGLTEDLHIVAERLRSSSVEDFFSQLIQGIEADIADVNNLSNEDNGTRNTSLLVRYPGLFEQLIASCRISQEALEQLAQQAQQYGLTDDIIARFLAIDGRRRLDHSYISRLRTTSRAYEEQLYRYASLWFWLNSIDRRDVTDAANWNIALPLSLNISNLANINWDTVPSASIYELYNLMHPSCVFENFGTDEKKSIFSNINPFNK